MIVLVADITPRVKYIFDFVVKEITGELPQLTTDRRLFASTDAARINYTSEKTGASEFFIQPQGLLSATGISPQDPHCFETNGYKAFFATAGDWSFDLFAASFYLLSRYEEYLPHKTDAYGRYAHSHSIAFREGFLQQPLINQWVLHLSEALKQRFPALSLHKPSFTFLPTYDIDVAWSYRCKGFARTAGGLLKDLFKANWKAVSARIRTLRGKQADPFDCYAWLNQLHQQYRLKPYYFFLLAEKRGRYDKNISPRKKALCRLVTDHLLHYPVGIHPSWRSGDEQERLEEEIKRLAGISGQPVLASRQHYIRFSLPETFRRLLQQGIRFDFSMGYGSINGFRASVTSPFYWYDLQQETTTDLLLFPFCFMEANSFYEQHQTPTQALEEMRHYYEAVRAVNGTFIMIWHNSFLGTDPLYAGWRETYQQFFEAIK